MNKVFEKIIEKLEEKARFYNSASDVDQNIRSGVIIAKEIVQETAAEYEVCYNDCGDCEAYNKEKHHCPKFCKVITETVREIEENHNGWIPCSERLPEEHKLYDITFKNSAGIHSDSAIYNPYLKRWLWDADETELVENEILAWAEKREPYQQKGENDENTK